MTGEEGAHHVTVLAREQGAGGIEQFPARFYEIGRARENGALDGGERGSVGGVFAQYPILFAISLFLMSIMLFSQAATVKTLYPVGLAMGIPPMALLAMFPAVNGYFFLPTYPTEVAAIGFDRTGTTKIGKYVINHSFQLSGFITTIVSIGLSFLIISLLY